MINWNDFIKRRKIDVSILGHTTYPQFIRWCRQVGVVPLDEITWLQSMNDDTLVSIVEGWKEEAEKDPIKLTWAKPDISKYTEKQLRKKKKIALQNLCDITLIEYLDTDTKSILISKLLGLNNQ